MKKPHIAVHLSLALLALATSAANASCAEAAPTTLPAAPAVIQRHFEAVGGRAALAEVESLLLKGTLQEGARAMAVELAMKAPGMLLMKVETEGGFSVRQGRSSQAVCWRQDGDRVGRIENTAQQYGMLDLLMGIAPFGQLRMAELYSGAHVETAPSNGRGCLTLRPNTEAKPALWFERDSGLLARKGNLRFADYRPAGNLKLPHTIQLDPRVVVKVREIQLNPKLDDALFDMPKGSEPREGQGAAQFQTRLSPAGQLAVVRHPAPMTLDRAPLRALPQWDPQSSRHTQVDLRGADLRQLEVADRAADLLHSDFDDRTQWPATLPADFQPAQVMALGKDPGLGIRELHAQGLTGKGIGIGVIDQTLLVDHAEYRDRLRLYEEIHNPPDASAAMHGPAVASIALGKTLGVAPAADLYYIAEWHAGNTGRGFDSWDFASLAASIQRLLEVNQTLPKANRIRVISISVGWSPNQKGYAETMAAVERAKKDGVFIISTCITRTHGLSFNALGREALADPNQAKSFGPGVWWQKAYWDGQVRIDPAKDLLVPMDARTTASPTGPSEYVHYDSGGWSWAVPWIAGLYALACEVKPDITPEEFWREALKTGQVLQLSKYGREHEFGAIANPPALIARLRALGR
jgi:hypothetical protein